MDEKIDWIKTTNRFVALFDILGFKELVLKSSHDNVLSKLTKLRDRVKNFENLAKAEQLRTRGVSNDQTKSVTFSDSFIFFSKSDKEEDALKIITDTYGILKVSLEYGIPIKGALSHGQITVDFEKSLFFGQPIIDAYLLHDELYMLTAILDHSAENRFEQLKMDSILVSGTLVDYKANLKSGRINHKVFAPGNIDSINSRIPTITNLYKLTSGSPRTYIDNTLDFLKSVISDLNKK